MPVNAASIVAVTTNGHKAAVLLQGMLSLFLLPFVLSWFLYIGAELTIGEGSGAPLQRSCLETPMDGGAWWAAVHRVAEGRTRLSHFPFTFHFPALEKDMAAHARVLAWRVPGTGEPGGLPSVGPHRVGHDGSDSAAAELSISDTFASDVQDVGSVRHRHVSILLSVLLPM